MQQAGHSLPRAAGQTRPTGQRRVAGLRLQWRHSNVSARKRGPPQPAREPPMTLHRRTFLRAAGISLALPCLDAFAAAPPRGNRQTPRRMVCLCTPLGLHPPYFFPEKAGKDYALTPYLEVLKEFRDNFTVVSG